MSSRGGARGRVVPYESILKTNRTHVAPAERKAGEAGRDPTSHGWRVGTSDVQPGFGERYSLGPFRVPAGRLLLHARQYIPE